MASSDKELELLLLEAGNKLAEPPTSTDDLITVLDQLESFLSRVEQSPNESMLNAVSPSIKALIAEHVFRHPDNDVKVAVAACISEITRITAPDAPYLDDQMKEVFQLIVSSFADLSGKSSRSYIKRTSILEIVAKVRSCVVMLDLECDALIVEMFQHFLNAIRDYHEGKVFTSMVTIMALVLEESEDISMELLSAILACVKRDNEEVLPIARRLAETVLENCASILKPYLTQAVEKSVISFEDYSAVVASICQVAPNAVGKNDIATEKQVDDESRKAEAPLDNAIQENKDIPQESVLTEQVDDLANGKSLTSVVSNGFVQTGENNTLDDSESVKKQEDDHLAGKSQNADGVEGDKVVNSDSKLEESTEGKGSKSHSKSTEPSDSTNVNEKEIETLKDADTLTAEPDGLGDEKVVNSDSKSEERTKKKGRKSHSKSTKPSESNHVDEKEVKILTEHEDDKKVDAQHPPSEDSKSEERSKKKERKSHSKSTKPSDSNHVDEKEVKILTEHEDDKKEDAQHPPSEDSKSVKRTKKKERKSHSKSTKPSDSNHVDEKAVKTLTEHKDDNKDDAQHPPSEHLSVDGAESMENKKETDVQPSANKATKDKSNDVASPIPSGAVHGESHSKRAARPKKKDGLSKETIPYVDNVSKKSSEVKSGSEEKTNKRSGKKAASAVSSKDSAPVDVDKSGEESGTESDSDAKPLKQLLKKVDSNSNNADGTSSRQLEDKKRRARGKVIREKDGTKISTKNDDEEMVGSPKEMKPNKHDSHMDETPKTDSKGKHTPSKEKEMVGSKKAMKPSKHDTQMDETPKTNSKRKHTPSKEKASDTLEYDENLVGLKVKVWWPKDRVFYDGHIQSYDRVQKKHKVCYDDGDVEILNLKREKWEVIKDKTRPDEEGAADHPSPDGLSEIFKKKKAKAADQTSKKAKMDSSAKRGGGASKKEDTDDTPKSKQETAKRKKSSSSKGNESDSNKSVKKRRDEPKVTSSES